MLVVISILSCVICIVVKWIFSFLVLRQERAIAVERTNYHNARKVLHLASQRYRSAMQELKQWEAKIKLMQQNIGSLNRKHHDLNTKKEEMNKQIQQQKELMKEMRKSDF